MPLSPPRHRAAWKRRRGETRPLSGRGLHAADGELLRVLARDLAEARPRAGDWLRCGPGCSGCCHGPFPVTRLDAWRLQQGLAALELSAPARAARVRQRAERCAAILGEDLPADTARARLPQEPSLLDPIFERHTGLPCPALDPGSGRCELYEWRPVSCRTFGPPLLFGERVSPPCDLCFQGAAEETIESCRVQPDRAGLERAILRRIGVPDAEDRMTLIAFALLS